MTEMSTSEVLNKAADLIEERGWRTGGGWIDRGRGICLEGGIVAALGIGANFEEAGGDDDGYDSFKGCPAYRAVLDYLAGDMGDDTELWQWNDRRVGSDFQKRSPEQVIATLRATALIEAARERESVEV